MFRVDVRRQSIKIQNFICYIIRTQSNFSFNVYNRNLSGGFFQSEDFKEEIRLAVLFQKPDSPTLGTDGLKSGIRK